MMKNQKAIASHYLKQIKVIAHFSKTNLIALRKNHNAITSHPPQEKRSPTSAKSITLVSETKKR
jgi:hypothetical protein